jgi:hypothetical protein
MVVVCHPDPHSFNHEDRIRRLVTRPGTFLRLVEGGSNIEANYAASMLEWARQIFDGRMAYSAVTTDTVATLLGRPPISWNTGRGSIAPISGSGREAPQS